MEVEELEQTVDHVKAKRLDIVDEVSFDPISIVVNDT